MQAIGVSELFSCILIFPCDILMIKKTYHNYDI